MTAAPATPLTPADYEAPARARLDPNAWAYFDAAAGDGATARANRAAWDALALWPRVLRPLAGLDAGSELLGRPLPWPVLAAPMALQRMAHADGEVGMALAASAQGAGLVASCEASQPLEAIAQAMLGGRERGPLWLQLYFLSDRGALLALVQRAEAAGFEALVVTVDASVRAARGSEQRAGFQRPPGIAAVNLPPAAPASFEQLLAQAPTWDDIAWLRGRTRLPILLKGVLHPADARQALAAGTAGVIVSNHGGRTLDGAVDTATALPRVADALGGALPVLVDGGIRSGTDVLRALALGARAVLVGRPLLWALAARGAPGVAHALRLLHDELRVAMAQCGAVRLGDLGRELVIPAGNADFG